MLGIPEIGIITKSFIDFFNAIFKIGEYKNAKSEKRLKEVFLPIFISIHEIHTEYIRMIDFCRRAIPTMDKDNSKIYMVEIGSSEDVSEYFKEYTLPRTYTSEDYKHRIEQIKKFIDDERERNDFNRIRVRANCAAILYETDDLLEKRFLVSIFNYFLNFAPFQLDDEEIDEWIGKLVEDNGPNRYTGTPSYVIKTKIYETENHEEILQILNDARVRLNDYYPQIAYCFAKMNESVF
jgi:hypothetical protein